MRLWYFLRFDTPEYDAMAIHWEDEAAKFIDKYWMTNPLLEVSLDL